MASSRRSTISKSKPSSCLENILGKCRAELAPDMCFDLCGTYRTDPRYDPNRAKRTDNTDNLQFKPIEFDVHQYSAQNTNTCTTFDENGDVATCPTETVWECPVCHTRDRSLVEMGSDSAGVCRCGAVDSSVAMIGQERAKNCPRGEDTTQVADLPAPSAEHAAYEAMKDGQEAPEARRRRENQYVGGTRVSRKTLVKGGMEQANSRVETQALKDANELTRLEPSACGIRGRRVLRALEEQIIANMPTMHKDMKVHLRLETIRIHSLSFRHEERCNKYKAKKCMYGLANRPALLLATVLCEFILEQLLEDVIVHTVRSPPSPVTTMVAKITSGSKTPQDVNKLLAELQQLIDKNGSHSRGQRNQIKSAVSIVSKFDDDEFEPCQHVDHVSTAQLLMPPSQANCPDDYGKCTLADPSDNMLRGKLPGSVLSASKQAGFNGDNMAIVMHQLNVPKVMLYCRECKYPCDIIAIAIVAAVAERLNIPNPLINQRVSVIRNHHISATIVDQFTTNIVSLIAFPNAIGDDDDGWFQKD